MCLLSSQEARQKRIPGEKKQKTKNRKESAVKGKGLQPEQEVPPPLLRVFGLELTQKSHSSVCPKAVVLDYYIPSTLLVEGRVP